jgi:hypothetical protein
VLPSHLLPWQPYYEAKASKSKSKLFLLACAQAQAFVDTKTIPTGWEDDNFDERHVTSFRDAFEESVISGPQTETLIEQHSPDFQPLRSMLKDNSTAVSCIIIRVHCVLLFVYIVYYYSCTLCIIIRVHCICASRRPRNDENEG